MSELIERVARRIDPWAWQEVGEGKMSNIPAAVFGRAMSLTRAPDAIAAVAEWLKQELSVDEHEPYVAVALMKQLEAPK